MLFWNLGGEGFRRKEFEEITSPMLRLNNNFGEKRKDGRGREEKWKKINSCLFRREGKEKNREMRFFPPNLFNFGEIEILTNIIHLIPLNLFPSKCLHSHFIIQTRDPSFL